MERIEPKIVGERNPRTGKYPKACGLDYCDDKHYSFGYCHAHYEQYRRLGYVTPRTDWSKVEYPDCSFSGCKKKSTTKTGARQLCAGHMNHVQPAHHAYRGEPAEFRYYKNEGYTENGRVCKDCMQEKPLDEFYNRNQWKGPDAPVSKSVRCKECYKKDVGYYQGSRTTKADGTDPLNYADNPAERERRILKRRAASEADNAV